MDLSFSISGTSFELHPYLQCEYAPKVIPMKGEDLITFKRNVDELNRVIQDDNLLRNKWEEWVSENSRYFELDFLPYNNRLLRWLFFKGGLPSFITTEKRKTILNHLECESHLDRLKFVVRNSK